MAFRKTTTRKAESAKRPTETKTLDPASETPPKDYYGWKFHSRKVTRLSLLIENKTSLNRPKDIASLLSALQEAENYIHTHNREKNTLARDRHKFLLKFYYMLVDSFLAEKKSQDNLFKLEHIYITVENHLTLFDNEKEPKIFAEISAKLADWFIKIEAYKAALAKTTVSKSSSACETTSTKSASSASSSFSSMSQIGQDDTLATTSKPVSTPTGTTHSLTRESKLEDGRDMSGISEKATASCLSTMKELGAEKLTASVLVPTPDPGATVSSETLITDKIVITSETGPKNEKEQDSSLPTSPTAVSRETTIGTEASVIAPTPDKIETTSSMLSRLHPTGMPHTSDGSSTHKKEKSSGLDDNSKTPLLEKPKEESVNCCLRYFCCCFLPSNKKNENTKDKVSEAPIRAQMR